MSERAVGRYKESFPRKGIAFSAEGMAYAKAWG